MSKDSRPLRNQSVTAEQNEAEVREGYFMPGLGGFLGGIWLALDRWTKQKVYLFGSV